MNLPEDLREFIELLNALEARYLVVGAYAVAYHGYPRYTRDLDLFVEPSVENAKRLMAVVEEFGFAELGLVLSDFTQPDQVIQLGVEPNRIDILTFRSGVSFDEAWATRVPGEIDGLPTPFISKEMLKRNKQRRAGFRIWQI